MAVTHPDIATLVDPLRFAEKRVAHEVPRGESTARVLTNYQIFIKIFGNVKSLITFAVYYLTNTPI
ncbi:MAG: hypothetical protein JWP71_3475 [Mucilaginibacter sp.]|nr:hypothetical protein [Mucilaginibacter sp.]